MDPLSIYIASVLGISVVVFAYALGRRNENKASSKREDRARERFEDRSTELRQRINELTQQNTGLRHEVSERNQRELELQIDNEILKDKLKCEEGLRRSQERNPPCRWDSAETLRDQEDIAAYLGAILEEAKEEPAVIAHAIGVIARAQTRLREVHGGVSCLRRPRSHKKKPPTSQKSKSSVT